jgi:hypothetical protein
MKLKDFSFGKVTSERLSSAMQVLGFQGPELKFVILLVKKLVFKVMCRCDLV